MSKKPIKSSLFRFVTLRSPQAIDDKESKFGLVLPSAEVKGSDSVTAESDYYQEIQGITDDTTRESKLANFSFDAFTTKSQLKNSKYKDLYTFSSWLSRNKNYLTYKSVASNLPDTALIHQSENDFNNLTLSLTDEGEAWDNLIHQTINKTSIILREAFIQMLITNKFLKEFSVFHQKQVDELGEGEIVDYDANEDKFQAIDFNKLANASVVIEKEVMLSKAPTESAASSDALPSSAADILRSEQQLRISKKRLKELRNVLKEAKKEEELYKKETQKQYDIQLAAHKVAVKDAYGDATPVMVDYTDPDTNTVKQYATYPNIVLPKFNFTPPTIDFQSNTNTFSKSAENDYEFLSEGSKELLKSTEYTLVKDFESLKQKIQEEIDYEEKAIFKAKKILTPKKINLNGTKVTVGGSRSNLLPYSFNGLVKIGSILNASAQIELQRTVTLTVYTGRTQSSLTNLSAKMVKNDQTEVVATMQSQVSTSESIDITLSLPLDNSYTLGTDWAFEATGTFENDDIVKFRAVLMETDSDLAYEKFVFNSVGKTASNAKCFPTLEIEENITVDSATGTIISTSISSTSGGVSENSFVGDGSIEFALSSVTPSVSTQYSIGFSNQSGSAGMTNMIYGVNVGGTANSKLLAVGVDGLGANIDDPWGLDAGDRIRISRQTSSSGGYEVVFTLLKANGSQFVMDQVILDAMYNEPWRLVFKFAQVGESFTDLTVAPCSSWNGTSNSGNSGNNNQTTSPILNGVTNLGVADFLRVEQEICCYVPGEVSHIENIMAKEYKEKSNRSLVSSEITTEQTRETEIENLTDTTSTERNELSSEVSSVIDQQNSTDFGANASVTGGSKLGGFSFTAGTSFGTSSSTATSNSSSQAQNYAQEVTERALERVVNKVSSKRTSRVLREFEENNKHGFDNTKGDKHVTGVYRWVDKVYKNQIVNYGKRLMYEFTIPEPARFLKEALTLDTSESITIDGLLIPREPIHPRELFGNDEGEFTAKMLEIGNYQKVAAEYSAEVEAHPDLTLQVSKGFSLSGGDASGGDIKRWQGGEGSIDIPDGYKADEAVASASFVYHWAANEFAYYSINIGETNHEETTFTSGTSSFQGLTFTLGGAKNSVGVAYNTGDLGSFSLSVLVNCSLCEEAKEQWQNETFNAIMSAYYDRMNEYNDFLRAEQDLGPTQEAERIKFNPAFNRSMEKRELKRCAIELLTQDVDIQLSRDRYDNSYPPKINTENLPKEASAIKFFEQAFDWEIMAYVLYPYYYANKDKWEELVQEQDAADPIFQAFFQSGIARVVVPVRQGFETAVNWYQATGEIWEGQGMVTDINDELYLSVAEELTDPVGVAIGTPWETKVPTSLTIVQEKSAYLPDGGLPCDPNCDTPSQFGETSLVISGGSGSNAADGVGADIVGTDNDVA